MPAETEDAFQKELTDLFIQEAQEWLQQIHVALDELQQAPPAERHRALAQTIKVGITNLGGSAATINLSDVERASFSALPFIEAVQEPSATIAAGDFLALCKQLGHIHGALTRATGVTFEAEDAQAAGGRPPQTIATKELLAILRGLQEQGFPSRPFHHSLVHTMTVQAEGLIQRGMEQCNVDSIQEFLDQSAEGEQGFLQVVRQATPHLTAALQAFQNRAVSPGAVPSDLQGTVERVAQLWSAAQQVNASQATTFFMGLHGFFTVVMQQRITILANHFDSVHSRLIQIVKGIEEWAERGQEERTAIQNALFH